MFKLLSLEGFLNLSFNAIKKAEDALSPFGFGRCERYDDVDAFLDAVVENIDAGNTVVLATENEEYNSVKKQLLRTFSLKKDRSLEIQTVILETGNGFTGVNDLEGHCLAPLEADLYITKDGLYSGFCVEFSNGARMIYVPLDEERFDDILPFIEREFGSDIADEESFEEDEKPKKDKHRGRDDDDDVDEAFVSGIFAAMVAEEEAKAQEEEEETIETEEEPEDEENIIFSEIRSKLEDISSFSEKELAPYDPDYVEPEEPVENEEEEEKKDDTESIPGYSETDSFVDKLLFSGIGDIRPDGIEVDEFTDIVSDSSNDILSGNPEKDENEPMLTLKNGEELLVDDNADEADLTGFEEAILAAERASVALSRLGKKAVFVGSDSAPFLLAMCDEVTGLSDVFTVRELELEGEDKLDVQVALAKKARRAISESSAEFGAAISQVIKGEKDGKDIYYAYIVLHDGVSAKAKKVSTATRQGVESLIPHAFAVMFGLVVSKAESTALLERDDIPDFTYDKKKKTVTIAVSVAAAAVAILSAVLMVWSYLRQPADIIINTNPTGDSPTQSTAPTASQQTLPTVTPQGGTATQYPAPAEPTATDVSNIPTSTPFSSTKGTFTFTVYGYGHGVGMSQTGADYYATIGKSYLEILAIYYYGATLVLGDTTPATVKFGDSEFTLRDYLATAVESEMGSSYNPEALKAQAVAVYTFAKYYNFDVPSTLHAFSKKPSEEAYAAVDIVMGQYMIYNGEVIRPYFHATSAGKTTSYTNAFGDSQIPYLAGGRPSYGDVNAKKYCTTVTYSSDELNALIYSKTGKQLTGDPANWFKILSHDSCISQDIGYVSKIQVGDEVYTGYDFRMKVLGGAIRSHCFTFIYTPTT